MIRNWSKEVCFVVAFFLFHVNLSAQTIPTIFGQIDSLFSAPSDQPFNGKLLIAKEGELICKKNIGYSDIPHQVLFTSETQFVVGSISKQFTAVLAMIEYEEGRLELDIPIKFYLPEINQSWADSVNIHHLLTHTHGIRSLSESLAFPAGSQFEYSQLGYELVSKVLEKTSGKSFEELAQRLFIYCEMYNSTHPKLNNYAQLAQAHFADSMGKLNYATDMFANYVAAGSFVSTPDDLLLWNQQFYSGKLLNKKVMQLLTSKNDGAVRNHPLFGITEYGYGITVDTKDSILQYGQTGWSPGFVSMSFYFPDTKLSLILMMNVVYNPDDILQTFHYHTEILNLVRKSELVKTMEPKKKSIFDWLKKRKN